MNQDENRPARDPAKQSREQRLREQLRANLQRRKVQTRARRNGNADERPEGLDAGKPVSEG